MSRRQAGSVVVLEGIYSMLGDAAPLKEFIAVCKKYGAYVLVDEAHSLGALGEKGRGLCEAVAVLDDCHHRRHLFQDAGRDRRLLRLQRSGLRHPACHHARYMFTASLPPSIVASVRQALQVVKARA